MAGEKYVIAASENSMQIAIRNILNPAGYAFLSSCSDSVSLMRLIRSYQPEFVIIDINVKQRDIRATIQTIDEEMLCACIIIGDYKDLEIVHLLENSKVLTFCPKPLHKDVFVHIVEMTMMNYRRMSQLSNKLKEMTESYETRKVVERAKWILMERNKIGETEAYDRMRKKSMDSRMSMKAIAEAIVCTYEITNKSGRGM